MISLLAERDYTVEDLAEKLGLTSSTVSYHLGRLGNLGLVRARAEGYYSIYQLEFKALEELSQALLRKETLPSIAKQVNLDAYDRKVLSSYLGNDGQLVQLPAQRKKLRVILKHIVTSFEVGKIYSEAEVNEKIAFFHEDVSGLRRDMISEGLLARKKDGSAYWCI